MGDSCCFALGVDAYIYQPHMYIYPHLRMSVCMYVSVNDKTQLCHFCLVTAVSPMHIRRYLLLCLCIYVSTSPYFLWASTPIFINLICTYTRIYVCLYVCMYLLMIKLNCATFVLLQLCLQCTYACIYFCMYVYMYPYRHLFFGRRRLYLSTSYVHR